LTEKNIRKIREEASRDDGEKKIEEFFPAACSKPEKYPQVPG
jgi:hypothetical protein